jgi:uncharacterized membrane protein YphA (DoxX/SURF4 family)
MSSMTLHRPVAMADGAKASMRAHRREPAYHAYLVLRVAFTVLPLGMGIDKYFNAMVDWPIYLAGWIHNILPGTPQEVMYAVGGVEILAGVLIALKPRYASYVVAAWLAGIVINLFSHPGFYDIAVRDCVLMVAALALARLASVYDSPLRFRANSIDDD